MTNSTVATNATKFTIRYSTGVQHEILATSLRSAKMQASSLFTHLCESSGESVTIYLDDTAIACKKNFKWTNLVSDWTKFKKT